MNIYRVLLIALVSNIVLAVATIIVYDLIAIAHGNPTLSMRIWTLAKEEPIFVLAVGLGVGLLLAHLFWRIQR